jgi:hypothetical protein
MPKRPQVFPLIYRRRRLDSPNPCSIFSDQIPVGGGADRKRETVLDRLGPEWEKVVRDFTAADGGHDRARTQEIEQEGQERIPGLAACNEHPITRRWSIASTPCRSRLRPSPSREGRAVQDGGDGDLEKIAEALAARAGSARRMRCRRASLRLDHLPAEISSLRPIARAAWRRA